MIRLEKPKDDNLNRLLRISNRILDSYGQPPLYATEIGATNRLLKHDKTKPPVAEVDDYTNCFHISLAWSLTEPSLEEQQRVSSIALDEMASLEINFSSVKAKIGNVVHSLNLASLWIEYGIYIWWTQIQCCLKVQAYETHGPTLASVANTTAFNLKITLKSVFHNWDVLRQHGQSSGTECHTGKFISHLALVVQVLTWLQQEDLQKFQASHFFGITTSPAGPAQSDLVENEEESYHQDDDLGYYKDGTKRTLTDEQIEIFRHSEIHALLRERERLREEEAEEQSDVEARDIESGKTSKVDGDIRKAADISALKRKSVEGSEDSSAKRAKDEEGTARPSECDTAASTQQPQQTASSRDINFGRKIVSYADDWGGIKCINFYSIVSLIHVNHSLAVYPGYMMKTSIVILSRTLYP